MWTRSFWKDAAERAVKTGVQAFLAFVGVDMSTTILSWSWPQALATAGTAALISIATSIVSTGIGDPTTPAALARVGRHRAEP